MNVQTTDIDALVISQESVLSFFKNYKLLLYTYNKALRKIK